MNKVLNKYEDFGKIIDKLSSKGMEDDSYYVQYVLSPYMQALGYDVFDIDETERMFSGDTYKVLGIQTDDGEMINFIFSLKDYRNELEDTDDVRAYVLFDKETKSVTLYYYVLNEWYSIYESRLLMEDAEDIDVERTNLVSLNKVISKDEFQSTYLSLRERLFTGSVIDSLLANGDLENRFIRQAVVDELVSPDDHMIKMIANKLTEYSTQETTWIEENLQDLKQAGIVKLLETAIANDEIEVIIRPKSQPLPSGGQKRVKKQAEVQTDIGHKADRLKDAGFSTHGLGQGAVSPDKEKTPVKETSKVEEVKSDVTEDKKEDKFGIGNLKDQLTSKVEESKDLDEGEDVSSGGLHDISNFFDED